VNTILFVSVVTCYMEPQQVVAWRDWRRWGKNTVIIACQFSDKQFQSDMVHLPAVSQ